MITADATSAPPPATLGSDADSPAPSAGAIEALRLAAVCLGLFLLTFAQNSGQLATDTKLDLVVDPLHFLHRALSLWDPVANAGQLQNQAYGYLFPMGPFFAAGHALHLAPWMVQRSWESLLLVAMFLGMFRLSRALGLQRFWPAVLAGLVYALSPRILSELTSISAELTPTVALPWILAPLVRGAAGASPRRSAALSGVAILFAGGTNAAATLAVLPVPALWLLTRRRGPRRRALITYWIVAVVLASLWWAVPLMLLGRYSPPFLDWIEAAQNTTATTSLSATLRGVPHWENYLGPGIWPAGWIYVSSAVAVVATSAVAAFGLLGLARRGTPNRGFLVVTLACGFLLVTFGHVGEVTPPFAGAARTLLDGPLNAFRNIHKFEPMVTLPVAFGCGIATDRLHLPVWATTAGRLRLRLPVRALAICCGLAVAALSLAPAVGGRLVAHPRTVTTAAWWPKAASWLATHAAHTRALVVPGAPTPSYIWGDTVDDALQPLARSPWLTRSSTPLARAGLQRLLVATEQALATGADVPSLAAVLAREGIGYLVLRNDLAAVRSGATPQDIVRATLTSSPGFERARSFGADLGGSTSYNDVIDGGAARPRPAVEIFRVRAATGPVSLQSLEHAVTANGSSDALPDLVAAGLSAQDPIFFGHDPSPRAGPGELRVTTDGIRRQQASFGGTFARSATLTPGQPFVGSRAAYDFLPPDPGPLSTVRYTGISSVTASSSGADVYAPAQTGPDREPWSVFDGDGSTAWISSATDRAVGQWLDVHVTAPITATSIQLAFAPGVGALPTAIRVATDSGVRLDPVRPTTATQSVLLPAGRTRSLRITVAAVDGGGPGNAVGISTLSVPGVSPQRALDVPGDAAADVLNFATAPGYRSGCLPAPAGVACQDDLVGRGEEDAELVRDLTMPQAGDYSMSALVRLTGSPQLDQRLDADLPVRATASSRVSADPQVRPGAAVDGERDTTWIAAPGDRRPTLTLTLPHRTTVRGVHLDTARGAAAAAPERVRVTVGAAAWTGPVPRDGVITLPGTVAGSTVSVTVLQAELRRSTSMADARNTLLPAGISSLTITGADTTATVPDTVTFDCTAGLAATVDGRRVPLAVVATTSDVLSGAPVAARTCTAGSQRLNSGPNRLSLARTAWALPAAMTLTRAGASLGGPPLPVGTTTVRSWGSTARRVQVLSPSRSVLVVHENYNTGWRASVHGHRLQAVEVDGWQQAFVVPAGTDGTVVLDYGPQRTFDAGLVVGLLAALLVVLFALLSRPGRWADTAALTEVRGRRRTVLVATVGFAWLVGGTYGLLLAVVLLAVLRYLQPYPSALNGRFAAGAVMIAALDIAAVDPDQRFTTAGSGVVQLLTLAAVVIVAGAGAVRRADSRRDP